jgi:hypothetical protein
MPKAKYPLGNWADDYLTMSNYGGRATLIMGLGDEFNGAMIRYSVCTKWAILGQSGAVDWGDQTAPTPIFFVLPLGSTQAGTIKTPQQIGVFQVTATIYGLCSDWYQHSNVTNSVQGKATAYVYDSIPITTFQLNCGTTSPCATVKGGQLVSGVVTTNAASPSALGTLIRIAITGPGITVPYIIEPKSQTTVAFDIPTIAVTANTNLIVSVNSGGTTLAQTITVTP